MSSDDNNERKLGRRDTLKLATAVSALGVGLGVLLDAPNAEAATIKLVNSKLGKLSIKLYKFSADGQQSELLHTLDLSAVAGKMKAGNYSLKFYNHKIDTPEMLMEQAIDVVAPTPTKQ